MSAIYYFIFLTHLIILFYISLFPPILERSNDGYSLP